MPVRSPSRVCWCALLLAAGLGLGPGIGVAHGGDLALAASGGDLPRVAAASGGDLPRVAAASGGDLPRVVAASGGDLQVGAAASLREAVEAGSRAFEAEHPGARVRVSYGASSLLAAQVRAGAPLEVLLSADLEIARDLADAGLAEAPLPLARNRLVIVASSQLPPFRSARDLTSPALRRIALPGEAVPIGRYARAWLRKVDLLDALEARLVVTDHARATLVSVEQGLADAAIVYATDAALLDRETRRAHVVWTIPDAEQPEISYAASVIGLDPPARRLARDYLAWWTGAIGRAALARAGFGGDAAP